MAAETSTLRTRTEDHRSSRCLKTSSITPGRRVRTHEDRTEGSSRGPKRNLLLCLLLLVNEFWVSVQRTEASERCGLSGSYWLKAENDVLILKDSKIKKNILVWPYKLLRRYGRDRVSRGPR